MVYRIETSVSTIEGSEEREDVNAFVHPREMPTQCFHQRGNRIATETVGVGDELNLILHGFPYSGGVRSVHMPPQNGVPKHITSVNVFRIAFT